MQGMLKVPGIGSSYGERAFPHTAPKLWTELPTLLRKTDSIKEFKSKLKTYLFESAHPDKWLSTNFSYHPSDTATPSLNLTVAPMNGDLLE